MSYKSALEAAGAIVLEFKEFGDYQGSWYAFVSYKDERGWVMGSYGSCTECDAFEAEFGDTDWHGCLEHIYQVDDCEFCVQQEAERQEDAKKRLVDFGQSYLSPLSKSSTLIEYLQPQVEWDEESESALKWIQSVDEQYSKVH